MIFWLPVGGLLYEVNADLPFIVLASIIGVSFTATVIYTMVYEQPQSTGMFPNPNPNPNPNHDPNS